MRNFTQDFAGLGGDTHYMKSHGDARYYHADLPRPPTSSAWLKVDGRQYHRLRRAGADPRQLLQGRRDDPRLRALGYGAVATYATGHPARRQELLGERRPRSSSRSREFRRISVSAARSLPMPARCGASTSRRAAARIINDANIDQVVGRCLGPVGFSDRSPPRRLRLGAHQGEHGRAAVVPLQRRHAVLIDRASRKGPSRDRRPFSLSWLGVMTDPAFFRSADAADPSPRSSA